MKKKTMAVIPLAVGLLMAGAALAKVPAAEADQLGKELTRLVEFLGPQLFESRVTLAYQQEDAPYHVQELSRREMFSHMTEGSRAGTKKLLQMLPYGWYFPAIHRLTGL